MMNSDLIEEIGIEGMVDRALDYVAELIPHVIAQKARGAVTITLKITPAGPAAEIRGSVRVKRPTDPQDEATGYYGRLFWDGAAGMPVKHDPQQPRLVDVAS